MQRGEPGLWASVTSRSLMGKDRQEGRKAKRVQVKSLMRQCLKGGALFSLDFKLIHVISN